MIGYHYVWDVYDCKSVKISFKEQIRSLMDEIVLAVGINKVGESYKQFEPVGATGIILLEESHLSIHTWPEHNFIAVDLFSCQKIDPNIIGEILKQFCETDSFNFKEIMRGEKVTDLMINR